MKSKKRLYRENRLWEGKKFRFPCRSEGKLKYLNGFNKGPKDLWDYKWVRVLIKTILYFIYSQIKRRILKRWIQYSYQILNMLWIDGFIMGWNTLLVTIFEGCLIIIYGWLL